MIKLLAFLFYKSQFEKSLKADILLASINTALLAYKSQLLIDFRLSLKAIYLSSNIDTFL